ncbi:cation transporter [Companilactobacillus ginsenosidimutans]|uniref:Cation transporter n=1 Tax=Companilactobacillus ginsenosidimutans TaxID=1007676 RepID=A0A0H4QD72_9LACO|nr:cation transporter [Companilactobacillus ginsenosidimutans]AKP66284.1 cation transporter [Companilactobacillus ginsenosidimutans]
MVNNPTLISRSLRIEYFSTAWMAFEFAVGFSSGIAAGSILLIAFGMDSFLEIIAGSTLIWRLRKEANHASKEEIEKTERISSLIVGSVLLLLSVYVVSVSIYNLINHQVADTSIPGMLIAIASVILMPILTLKKRSLGKQINSEALIEDGMCNITCAYMAATVLVGVIVTALFGLWRIDSVAALVLVYFIATEGWESLQNGLKK